MFTGTKMSKQFLLRRVSVASLIQERGFASFSPSVLSSCSVFKYKLLTSCSDRQLHQPARQVHSSFAIFAGHNRWSKIHRPKAIADKERSKIITKYRQRIISAVQFGGGPDPECNFKLASLISQAKATGMSKSQIDPLLKPDASKVQKEHLLFEAKAQAGYLIVVEVLTDNKKRTRMELKILLTKKG